MPFAVARDDAGVHVVEQELVIFLAGGLVEQLLPVCGERVFDFPFQAECTSGFLWNETGNLFQPAVADAPYERAQQPDLACLPVVEGSIQADEGRDAHGSGEPQLLRSAETGGGGRQEQAGTAGGCLPGRGYFHKPNFSSLR